MIQDTCNDLVAMIMTDLTTLKLFINPYVISWRFNDVAVEQNGVYQETTF